MRIARYHRFGGPEVLTIDQIERQEPASNEIRIAVRAVGINPLDWKIRAGEMQHAMPIVFPAGTGIDAAGVVDAVGAGVMGIEVGDEVFGSGRGVAAEYANLFRFAKKPAALSFEEAAGWPIAIETAYRILDLIDTKAGETILASGAAGAVGTALIQFANDRSVQVIGTASEGRQAYLRELGAIATTYGPGLADRVAKIAPNGVDAALDLSGSGIVPELIAIVGDPQKVLSIVDAEAAEHGAQVSFAAGDAQAAFERASELFEAGRFTIPVAHRFSLEEIAEAHEVSAEGHSEGRIVVIPS